MGHLMLDAYVEDAAAMPRRESEARHTKHEAIRPED